MLKQWWWLVLCLLLSSPTWAQGAVLEDETGTQYRVERYVTANFPVGMVFAPDGRLFYNEKITGNVRVVLPDGTPVATPIITLPTNALQERGMLGIALSPTFASDQWVYVMHTAEGDSRNYPANRLVRFTVDDDNQSDHLEELLRYPIETGQLLHNGGNIHFDRDGYLFLSLGDYGVASYAQDLSTPMGALHRFSITEAGLVPAVGNPFGDDNSIYAYGMRNPFDFTFDTESTVIFVSESGPSCDDEINAVIAGFNYGWDEDYECVGTGIITGLPHLYAPPVLSFTPPIAPTGIVVYEGDAFPQWQGDLLFCDWNTGTLRRVELSENRTRALTTTIIDLGVHQCRIDLVIGLDGSLYFGTVGEQSGAIMRIVPAS